MAHGKSTVVKAISGVHTVRFKNELERNITIKLGYANAKVRIKTNLISFILICKLGDSEGQYSNDIEYKTAAGLHLKA